VIKLFSEKVSPAVHDLAAKKEGLGAWKEEFIHRQYGSNEATIREAMLNADNKRREQHSLERSDMMVF
jgi:hypothetical protein